MSEDAQIDKKYYEVARPDSLSERILIKARDQIFEDFITQVSPTPDERILDVGVSDVVNDGANVLERKYRYQDKLTACGIGDAPDFRAAYPEVRYVQIEPNKPLPFEDGAFAVATANAVLEHVGSVDNQRFFVAELLRVSARVFISVPHRYFPVEHHTGIPLLHYTEASFSLACKMLGKSKWADSEQLILMDRAALKRLLPPGADYTIGYTGLRLGVLSSNLFLTIRRR